MRALWLAGLLALAIAHPACAAPANTLKEMFAQLGACVGQAPIAPGSDVTLLFSLNRRGGLIGKPRLTYARFSTDPNARADTAKAIAQAFDKCLPLSITDGLGGAIAGRPIAYRMIPRAKETGI